VNRTSRPVRRPTFLAAVLLLAAAVAGAPAVNGAESSGPKVPEGFRIEPAIQNLHHPTRLVFGPDGRLYVAQQTGEVIAVTLEKGREVSRQQVAKANLNLLGIALKDDRLWVSETGVVAVYTRTPDGRYEGRKEILKEIPHGRHQNDGLAWGPDGKLYLGVGSTTDRGPESHPWSATILRFHPDGTGVEVYARGFRNPYGIAFDPEGRLWATDNGADNPVTSDELNLVEQGAHYGYPDVFEEPPSGSPTKGPVALFGAHNSTNGLAYYSGSQFPPAYRGGIFVAMWGSSFSDEVGRAVGFVRLKQDGARYKGEVFQFATGFDRPLDLTVGPEGDLWVGDFLAGTVYRIWYEGAPGEGTGSEPPGSPAAGPPLPRMETPAPRWYDRLPLLPMAYAGGALVVLILALAVRRHLRRQS
jgi:glucose/arabinose dehydrogenase